MKKLQFSIDIKAPREQVWNVLWNDSTYRKWTSVFSEGSYAISDWNEGSKILFLDPEGNGMSSIIEKKIPNEFMSFSHKGEVKNKKELPANPSWSGAMESYTLRQTGEITNLKVELNMLDEHVEMFNGLFPKALQKVKEITEKSKVPTEAV
jgi:hypothetical protein